MMTTITTVLFFITIIWILLGLVRLEVNKLKELISQKQYLYVGIAMIVLTVIFSFFT